MNIKRLLLLCGSLLFINQTFSQVNVSPLTGAAGVTIPVYTVRSGQAVVPVEITYNGSGVKPKDVEGTAGIGWQLQAGGQVSRVVRGIPDDVTVDNASHSMLGWMSGSNTAAAAISSFSITNNGSTCSNETTDLSNISSHFAYNMDTEPDQFYVSAPGLSCQLVWDRVSGSFKPVSYQDLLINYTTDPTSHLIVSFIITNDKGVTYTFGNNLDLTTACEKVTQTTSGGSQVYFKTKYQQYQYGITYNDAWSLVNMVDVNGNGINLAYTIPSPPRGSKDSVSLYVAGASTATLQYYVSQSVAAYTLASITPYNNSIYSAAHLAFAFTNSTTGQPIISTITGFGRSFQFGYSAVAAGTGYYRYFLRSFSESGCSSPLNYQFGYVGETKSGSTYTTILTDSTQNKYDYWGYYSTSPGTATSQIPSVYVNPSNTAYPRYVANVISLPGSDYSYSLAHTNRTTDATNVAAGSLNKIYYVNGGNSTIVYESNDYYDLPSGSVIQGGGIRVKQLIDSAGTGSTNPIIHNYTYLNPSTGVSSGKPVSMPAYAFTIPYGGGNTGLALWTSATVLSAHDLSNEDHTIMYGYSKASQTGAGYTVYQFNVPATNWDASAAPACVGCTTEWYPTVNYIARTNCASTYGPVSNYTYSYPFIPNPNYDFERGLPIKVASYTDAGAEVSETDYTYQRSFTPTAIAAFKMDDDPNGTLSVKSYNKYTVYYNTSELTTSVAKKLFNSSGGTTPIGVTVNYTYGSANHKLVTQEQTTNSDGNITTANMVYSKDYTAASAGSNPNVNALYYLRQENVNIPVETYQQFTRNGNTVTTGASLSLFSAFVNGSNTQYLPSQQWKWVSPNGGSFTPMSISGQTLTKDAGYYDAANFDSYDYAGVSLTVDDNNKHYQTTLMHHFANQPIASFSNAVYGQMAYSDFDADVASPAYGFTISGSGSFTPVGSHAGNAAGLAANTQTVTSPTITRNTMAANYIFSIWINAASAGSLSLSVNGSPVSISYAGNSAWTYYEKAIPSTSLPSTFTVSFTAGTNISIDDILLYPDVAQASTATYDANTHYKLDATNTNGISTYYTNDQWGRVLYTLDQDKNVVQKNTFLTPADVATFTTVTIGAGTAVNGHPTAFAINGPDACAAAGVTVNWNFGDGTTLIASGLTVSHTYTSTGTFTVSATVSSPFFGTRTPSNINVTVQPAVVQLSYSNYTTSNGNISAVYFYNSANTTILYSFTPAQLYTATVPQGTYNIHVQLSGGTLYNAGTGAGYSCVYLNGDCITSCANFVSSNTYSFALGLSSCTTLNFTVSQYNCSHFGGGPE